MGSKSLKLVIMQPQFFPWIGFMEQIKLADIFVFGDDFKLSGIWKKNFYNRVQIKSPKGAEWLTMPLDRRSSPSSVGLLNEMLPLDNAGIWQKKHLRTLRMNYGKAAFFGDMYSIVEDVYTDLKGKTLSDVNIHGILRMARYFNIYDDTTFYLSSELGIAKSGKTQRIIDILKHFNATEYITGHGALEYLDVTDFAKSGFKVSLMDYRKLPYPQRFGDFTPYVSTLDLIANVGKDGAKCICSETVEWKNVSVELS